MTIKLTEAAAEEVKISKEEGHYLRVAVKAEDVLGLSTSSHLTWSMTKQRIRYLINMAWILL